MKTKRLIRELYFHVYTNFDTSLWSMKYCKKKKKKNIKFVRKKFKKRISICRKLSCVELKGVGTYLFIMQKDNPIAFNNIYVAFFQVWKNSVKQINEPFTW